MAQEHNTGTERIIRIEPTSWAGEMTCAQSELWVQGAKLGWGTRIRT